MKTLKELLKDLDISAPEVEVSALVYDSRKLCRSCLYIAIKGAKFDGHSAIEEAAKAGAVAILAQYAGPAQKKACEEAGCLLYITEDTRLGLAICSSAWFGHPQDELCTIGITGTKGKSTTAYMIRSAVRSMGYSCGLIGTVEIDTVSGQIPSVNTTPGSYELYSYLREMCDAGAKAVVMEVSSQGLMMHRVGGICFDVAVFTNISPDHIGPNEHKDFEDYLYCKSLLFKSCKTACVNIDDEHVQDILKDSKCEKTVFFGFDDKAELKALDYKPCDMGGLPGTMISFVHGNDAYTEKFAFPGRFSVYNILACISAVSAALPVLKDERDIRDSLGLIIRGINSALVKGRMELLPVSDEYNLMIDYAHNAMALESLLTALKEYARGRLITVFGCGGNRARSRRFEMGEVSGRLSDLTVITSDNPRDEEPLDIIKDIQTGIAKTDGAYVTIADRKEAIAYAMHEAKIGDIVILAGKGHETYQEIKGVKHHMDERELVYEILKDDGNDPAVERMLARYGYLK
ncbi:MAG: UDP-N-acetylmuramoyl-L-alanyl-D-glutamate--2,6-diaminopimelate ligase [Lachnospiraceae bacterium]|nr:UDP-N-acetylmuramoyl-L-alanyl-D-glutamate--2,6-diaminopimelate ligase [Lachnospiraceae bacterium]